MQLLAGVQNGAAVPAWPSYAHITVGLVVDVFVGEDDDVVAEDHKRIAKLMGAAFAILETLVGEDVCLRPEPEEGLAAQRGEDPFRRIDTVRRGKVEELLRFVRFVVHRTFLEVAQSGPMAYAPFARQISWIGQ